MTGSDPVADTESAELLFGLGRAQIAALPRDRWTEAANSLRRAFDYYVEAGDVDRAVIVAEHPFPALFGRRIGMAQLVSRALELVPLDSHQAGRLLSRYGILMVTEMGDHEGAEEAFGKALAIAHREGDEILEMRTLTNDARAEMYRQRYQQCLEQSLRVIQLAARADDPQSEMGAHDFAARVSLRMGDPEAAQRHAEAVLLLAKRLGDAYSLVSGFGVSASISGLKGDWRAARDFIDQGFLAGSSEDTRLLLFRTMLEYEVGDFLQGKDYLERLLEVMHLTPPGPVLEYSAPVIVIALAARITGTLDRLDDAERAAEIVLSSPSATSAAARFAHRGLALLAVLRGDEAASREQYAILESQRGTLEPDKISTDRLLGLLAHTMGNLDLAAEHFEDAL